MHPESEPAGRKVRTFVKSEIPSMRPLGATGAIWVWLCVAGVGSGWAQDGSEGSGAQDGSGGGQITKLPVLKKEVPATYPSAALRDRVRGTVRLEFTITATGAVTDVRVTESSTQAEVQPDGSVLTDTSTVVDYGFETAARAAVSQFRFEPAEAGGTPVPVTVPYTLEFTLPPAPQPAPSDPGETDTATPTLSVVNFRGTLRERGTRSRIPGAVVTIFRIDEGGSEPTGFEAVSDGEGRFAFYDLEPGVWKVLAEKDGYYPVRTEERVVAGQLTEVTYFMERGTYNPYDVEVVGERVFKEVSRRTLSGAALERVPGTLGDPIANVENLPGVARTPFGTGALPIRGSAPADSGIFFEGIETPFVFHVGALKSVVPAEVVESVEFIPGNFSAYYGRATGGILDVQFKDLAPDQVHGQLQLSLLDGSGFVEVPITDEVAIAGGFRRSFVGEIAQAALGDDESVEITAAPVYQDYQVFGSYRPSPSHSLQVFFFGSRDRLELLNADAQEASIQLTSGSVQQEIGFNRVIAQYRYTPSERFTNELQVAFGVDELAFAAFDFLEFDLTNYQGQIRNNSRFQISDALSLDVGFDGLALTSNVFLVAPDPDQDPATADFDDTVEVDVDNRLDLQLAPYIEANWQITDRLELVPGLRFDYYSQPQLLSVDPRLSARYRFTDQWSASAGVGLYTQPPLPQQLDATFGNENVGLERSVQTSLGATYRPLPFLSFDVTFFYKRLFDFISESDDRIQNDEGEFVSENVDNNTTGNVYGMEVFIRHEFNKNFRGWMFYTLSRSERTPEGEPTQLFAFDQTHIFGLVASYQLPQNWELGVRWRVISGSPFTPVVGGIYQEDQDTYVAVTGEANSQRLATFNQFDIRLDKRWVFDALQVSAFLQVINAYNAPNVEGISYNFDFSESSDVRSLPILPIVGVEVVF